MGKHKHKTLRKRKINRKKYSTLKHRPLKNKKHYRGGGSPQSSRTSSPSNYSLKGMYSRLKSSLGITPHSISLNKIVKTVLKDIPKEKQDQFITTLKSNLTKWVKDLGHETSTIDQHLTSDYSDHDHTNIDHRRFKSIKHKSRPDKSRPDKSRPDKSRPFQSRSDKYRPFNHQSHTILIRKQIYFQLK